MYVYIVTFFHFSSFLNDKKEWNRNKRMTYAESLQLKLIGSERSREKMKRETVQGGDAKPMGAEQLNQTPAVNAASSHDFW